MGFQHGPNHGDPFRWQVSTFGSFCAPPKNGESRGPEGKPVDGCLLWFLCSSQTY